MARVIVDGSELRIEISDLLNDKVLRQLAKHAIFDDTVIEGIGQLLVRGSIEYHDSEHYEPWYAVWSGRGACFEKARRIFLKMAPRIAQRLVDDLTAERDKLAEQRDEWRDKAFTLERQLGDAQARLRAYERQEALNNG